MSPDKAGDGAALCPVVGTTFRGAVAWEVGKTVTWLRPRVALTGQVP